MATDQSRQADTAGGKDPQPGRSCTSFVGTYPKVALSVLIGAVGISGLLNAVVFFTTLGIPYRLYLGATDFMAVAVRSSPSVLGTVIALLALALALGLVVWLVVEAGLRLLPRLFSWRWHLEPRCSEIRARLEDLASPAFADRHYRPIFVIATLLVLVVGGFANQLSAERVQDRLRAAHDAADRSGQPVCSVLEQMRDHANGDSVAASPAGWPTALFDYFYVDGYLRCASLKLADLDAGVGGLVLLGSTASHSFFYRIDEGFHFTVPTESIESVAQTGALPGILANPEQAPEPDAARLLARAQATLSALLETHTTIANALGRIARPTLIVLPERAAGRPPADRCMRIEDVEFRFDLASADYDDDRHAAALERLEAYFRSAAGQLAAADYVLVVGHADTLGEVNFNQRLSERRAEAVRERLAREGLRGVAAKAHAIGVGEGAGARHGDPSKAANRRVVVYHCRPDFFGPPDAELVDHPTHGDADRHLQASLSTNAAVR